MWMVFCILPLSSAVHAQGRQEPGKSIGAIATRGDLIVMTLDEEMRWAKRICSTWPTTRCALRRMALSIALKTWHGSGTRNSSASEMAGSQATLKQTSRFLFPVRVGNLPFSVGITGSMTFGEPAGGGRGGRGGGRTRRWYFRRPGSPSCRSLPVPSSTPVPAISGVFQTPHVGHALSERTGRPRRHHPGA